jgi:hypothetical protein
MMAKRRRPARARLLQGDPCGTRTTASFADSEIPSSHARYMKPFILVSLQATKEEILAALPAVRDLHLSDAVSSLSPADGDSGLRGCS